MCINGLPSPSDLTKGGVPSNGVGPHSHGEMPKHSHGEPTFTDAQVAFLEQRGYHCDRHHGVVLDADGSEVPPGIIGPLLLNAKQEGILKVATSENGMMTTGACETGTNLPVSGPGG